jgi:hypothetical protein
MGCGSSNTAKPIVPEIFHGTNATDVQFLLRLRKRWPTLADLGGGWKDMDEHTRLSAYFICEFSSSITGVNISRDGRLIGIILSGKGLEGMQDSLQQIYL